MKKPVVVNTKKEPVKIAFLKADFISTVAVLAASDAEWKLEDILPYAEEICQKAGERYNEMLVAEQDRELKKAVEAEAKVRYARVEYMDGDVRYWTTALSKGLVSDGKFQNFVNNEAIAERPFMGIRKAELLDTRFRGEGVKVTYAIKREELL